MGNLNVGRLWVLRAVPETVRVSHSPMKGKPGRPASLAVFAPEAVWDGLAEKERCHWAFARALVCACVCMALCTK